jgi:cysteinyl-tRNA synthetase
MSKSLGNFVTLSQALARFSPNSMRLFYLMAHYRSPLDYEEEKIEGLDESVERIFNSLGLLREECKALSVHGAHEDGGQQGAHEDAAFRKESDALISDFWRFMDDDLNTPEAIAAMFSLLRLSNSHLSMAKMDKAQLEKIKSALEEMLSVLGLEEVRADIESKKDAIAKLAGELRVPVGANAAATLEMLIDAREKARAAKDYAKSDTIRSKLKDAGIILEDKTKGAGPRWKLG